MKKLFIILTTVLSTAFFTIACSACNSGLDRNNNGIMQRPEFPGNTPYSGVSADSGTTNTAEYSNFIELSADSDNLYPVTYNEADYTSWQTYDFGTEYTFDVSSKTWTGTSPLETGIVSETLKSKSLKLVNLTDSPLNIRLTGNNSSFKITIDGNAQAVKITFDNLNLVSEDRAVNIKNSSASYIVLEGSSSLETKINSYDKNVLKTETDLILDGTGELSVTANSKNGIVTEYGVLAVLNGNITITVSSSTAYTNDNDTEDDTSDDTVEPTKGTAVSPMLGFVMLNGNLTICGNNSSKGYESKGIKVNGYEEDEVPDESLSAGKGWIVIDGGTITVKTQGKAISAGWKQSEDDLPSFSVNYPVPNVYINGGTFDIQTFATPRDDTAALDGVSPEGIEAKNNLYITGGTLVINSTDDSLNASNGIYISEGLIYAKSSQNDAIDAGAEENQGYMNISGGTVIALGSGQPETGFDCNSNTRFEYTGGVIIAMGGGQNNTPQAEGTTAYTTTVNNVSAGKNYALIQNDTVVLVFKVPEGYSYGNCVLLGSGDLTTGNATLISACSVNAENCFDSVLYYGTAEVSNGKSISVTVSNSTAFPFGGQVTGNPDNFGNPGNPPDRKHFGNRFGRPF